MKTLRINSLEKGWCDRDYVLLHASFQILVDFVELEKPDKIIDWDYDSKHRKVWRQIWNLHKWWKFKRPARVDPLDDKNLKRPPFRLKKVPGTDYFKRVEYDRKKFTQYESASRKHWKLEQKWFDEDQKNLHALIDIRPYLWT